MIFENLKLWIPYRKIILKQKFRDNKNLCLFYFGENVKFLETYQNLGIKKNMCRYLYMPTIVKPIRSTMTELDKKKILEYGLKPTKDYVGNYTKVKNRNFYYVTKHFDVLDKRFSIKKYNTARVIKYYTNIFNIMFGLNSEEYIKTLLYCVDTTKELSKSIFYRKFYPVYDMLLKYADGKIPSVPFDSILMFVTTDKKSYYVKIYDKDLKNNSNSRLKNILIRIKHVVPSDEDLSNEVESKNKFLTQIDKKSDIKDEQLEKDDSKAYFNDKPSLINSIVHNSDVGSIVNKSILKSSLDKYFSRFKNVLNKISKDENFGDNKYELNKLGLKSVAFNMSGDSNTADKIIKRISTLDNDTQEEVIQRISKKLVNTTPNKLFTNNIFVKESGILKIVNNHTPKNIIEKRIKDFDEHLTSDIVNAFKVLENQNPPLYVKKIEKKTIKSPISEINESFKDRYFIDLADKNGKVTTINIDIPHIDKYGFFKLNGIQQIMVNQLVRFPVTFPNIETARFESSFSTIKILNKSLKTGSYYIFHIGNYKFPIIMYLSIENGFEKTLNDFGVKVRIE